MISAHPLFRNNLSILSISKIEIIAEAVRVGFEPTSFCRQGLVVYDIYGLDNGPSLGNMASMIAIVPVPQSHK